MNLEKTTIYTQSSSPGWSTHIKFDKNNSRNKIVGIWFFFSANLCHFFAGGDRKWSRRLNLKAGVSETSRHKRASITPLNNKKST